MDQKEHWDKVYGTKAPDMVSWYAPHLETSLGLIHQAATHKDSTIIDVGGGESTLVDDLIKEGYRNISLLDISKKAIEVTKKRLGSSSRLVNWYCSDIRTVTLPQNYYEVWHDRAVFHFLTQEEDRRRYVEQVLHSVKSGGYVIISTFGPDGPKRCSGLNVVRYDAEKLHSEFGKSFSLIGSLLEEHKTPMHTAQQFLYCFCRVS